MLIRLSVLQIKMGTMKKTILLILILTKTITIGYTQNERWKLGEYKDTEGYFFSYVDYQDSTKHSRNKAGLIFIPDAGYRNKYLSSLYQKFNRGSEGRDYSMMLLKNKFNLNKIGDRLALMRWYEPFLYELMFKDEIMRDTMLCKRILCAQAEGAIDPTAIIKPYLPDIDRYGFYYNIRKVKVEGYVMYCDNFTSFKRRYITFSHDNIKESLVGLSLIGVYAEVDPFQVNCKGAYPVLLPIKVTRKR